MEITRSNHDAVKRRGPFTVRVRGAGCRGAALTGPAGQVSAGGTRDHTQRNTQDKCVERTNKTKQTVYLQESSGSVYLEGSNNRQTVISVVSSSYGHV